MLITYNGLVKLVEQGVIEGVDPSQINGASIDVRLGPTVWVEDARGAVVDLARKEAPVMRASNLEDRAYTLRPGEFVLAHTVEVFNLPEDISCEFRLKSSTARAGLDQALAVWCDPGWHGSVLTMELRNNLQHHSLLLRAGMKVGQMVFFRGEPVPVECSYATKGQYNNDLSATPSRGAR